MEKELQHDIRVGIIGLGNMGTAHATAIAGGEINGLTLAAIADTDPARLDFAAQRFSAAARFDSAAALLASGLVDAVIVATPHWFHPSIVAAALEQGLHALSEKPAGVSVSQLAAVRAAQAKTGAVFGIMFNQRTNPLFAKARQLVRSGELGAPKRLVWIITNWYRNQAYYDSGAWRASWRGEGGGVLINQAPHNLDLVQWIFGMPARVWATCEEGKYHSIEVEDDATIQMRYANGAAATFITTTGEHPGTNRLEISGDRGKLVLEDSTLKYWKLDGSEREFCFDPTRSTPPTVTYTEEKQTVPETAHKGILQNWADAIRYGTPLLAPGLEGENELTLSNAAYLSSWTGKWVELPLDTAAFDAELAKRVATSRYDSKAVTPEETDGKYKDRWSVKW